MEAAKLLQHKFSGCMQAHDCLRLDSVSSCESVRLYAPCSIANFTKLVNVNSKLIGISDLRRSSITADLSKRKFQIKPLRKLPSANPLKIIKNEKWILDPPASAETGGGGRGPASFNGNGGNSGGQGGSGEGAGEENDRNEDAGILQLFAEKWKARVDMDPNFTFKLFIECFNDACIIIAVNLAKRGDRFLKELEFTLCHIAVSLLNDASLVWLLAPVRAQAGANLGTIASLPQHCFQQGAFSLNQRIGCFLYKAALYSGIGFTMGILGTALVHGLTNFREKVDPAFEPPQTVQPIFKAGLVWLVFMGGSSNTRYQLVNGLERVIYGMLPGGAAKSVTVASRLANNFLGSIIFVWLANKMDLTQSRPIKVLPAMA